MQPSAHIDTFTRDNLPAAAAMPEFLLGSGHDPEKRLNCITPLLDAWVANGHGDAPCLIGPGGTMSYAALQAQVNRIANVLTGPLGMVSGNRVLLRAANTPMMVATYLAVLKAGGVVVPTMPLLRATELSAIANKACVTLALCDARLADELEKACPSAPTLARIVHWGESGQDELDRLIAVASPEFTAWDTAADDICLIGFTSGTTGEPKGTLHFHRDMLAICETYAKHVLRPRRDDVFIGSPPLAFTFGLGGLVLFPLFVGASTVLVERPSPDELLQAISRHRATILFTAPTAYRVMLAKLSEHDISSLRKCVSAGEPLPEPTYRAWLAETGIKMMDGIGSTEMLHIFVGSGEEDIRPGLLGRPVPGYEAKVIGESGKDLPAGSSGRLAVRGPTGCRYLDDPRQANYVENGWNVTGDTCSMDADGYIRYLARSDDMIVSAGYNIAGPEVEAALLKHPAVAECGVIGVPDADRGTIIKAFIVPCQGHATGEALSKALADHVKAEIAPYKYPRAIEYVSALPKTATGKIQRSELRRIARTQAETQ